MIEQKDSGPSLERSMSPAAGKPSLLSPGLPIAVIVAACLVAGSVVLLLWSGVLRGEKPTGTTRRVDPSTLKPGPIRHEQLSDEQMEEWRKKKAMEGPGP